MKISLLMLPLILLFSCKKETTDNPNPVSPSSNSPVLLKWFAIDTTKSTPRDTIGKMTFTYDGNNRPAGLTYLDYKPNGDSNFFWKVNYEYNGMDSLAAKTIEYTKEFQSPVSISNDTFYYHFTNFICDRDSVRGTNGGYYFTNNYVYFSNYIKRTTSSRTFSPSYTGTGNSTIYQTKVNGNVTYQIDTLVTQYIATGQPPITNFLKNEYAISYGINPDPFYKITRPVKLEYYSDNDWLPFGKYVSKNLVNTINHSQSSWTLTSGINTSISTTRYSYIFRSDGMPVEGRITYSEPGYPDSKYKTIYIYQ